jgi:hypothetical protein
MLGREVFQKPVDSGGGLLVFPDLLFPKVLNAAEVLLAPHSDDV